MVLNPNILHTEIQEYIFEKSNKAVDIAKLILSGSPFEQISIQELAQQISGRRKAKGKLPLWYQTKEIYYPPTINLEQTSSEAAAHYKSELVSGDTLIDITGGFGIDDYYFSKKMKHLIHCELNIELSKIASHNFQVLGVNTIESYAGDGLKKLEEQDAVDWIYIDPSRRHDHKGKVFFLEDCLPDVPSNLELLFSKSTHVLIKTSPLLDIHAGLKSLQYVKEIHVVAVHNEVKELLWVLERGFESDTTILAVNLVKDQKESFSFSLSEEKTIVPKLALPKKYIYEPNAAIMKAGGFYSVAKAYGLEKLHPHSHIYTSDHTVEFPGRVFEVLLVLPYQKQLLKKQKIVKANITTRNFPETVSEIRKKFKIKEGGDRYLFFTTNCNHEKVVLVCEKIIT